MVRVRVLSWRAGITRETVVVTHGNISRSLRGILLGLDRVTVPKLEVPQDRFLRIKSGKAEWL
jgi:broad specificity phosphatase PhoE